jgi:FkbM family methyltransferase
MVGTVSTAQWVLIRIGGKFGISWWDSWKVHPRQAQHALVARLRGSSDICVFNQIFVREEYRCLRDLEDVSLVLDLGANVGYSSAYFLSAFPHSRVVAVEPDERNVAVYQTNLASYGNRSKLLHGAVWAERTELCLAKGTYGDGREWATQVIQPLDGSAGSVPAWDISSLIDIAEADQVDLLKVDIERSELAVFGETAKKWLPKIRNICIELHGRDCKEVFFNALADFDFEASVSGELSICRNIRPKTVAR